MKTLELDGIKHQIPENASELSLKKWVQVGEVIEKNNVSGTTMPLTYENVLSICEIVTEIDKNILENSPIEFFEMIVYNLEWLFNINTDNFKIKDEIKIGNDVYIYDKDRDILVKEWVDIDTIIKEFPVEERFAGVLAVRLRKKDEKYDSKFIQERIKLFNDCPVSDVLPIVNFFLTNEKIYAKNMTLFSAQLALAHIRQQQVNEWAGSGGGIQHLSTWQKKIYLKLTKYLNEELSKLSTFCLTAPTSIMPSEKILNEKKETNKN